MNAIQSPSAEKNLHQEFETWIRTVRDPAMAASEGVRRIVTKNKKAEAGYQIAPLPDGRFAMQYDLSYNTGNCSGSGSPWTEFNTREECVEEFLRSARRHFGCTPVETEVESDDPEDVVEGSAAQQVAQKQMIELLDGGGLFGFIEPEVTAT